MQIIQCSRVSSKLHLQPYSLLSCFISFIGKGWFSLRLYNHYYFLLLVAYMYMLSNYTWFPSQISSCICFFLFLFYFLLKRALFSDSFSITPCTKYIMRWNFHWYFVDLKLKLEYYHYIYCRIHNMFSGYYLVTHSR